MDSSYHEIRLILDNFLIALFTHPVFITVKQPDYLQVVFYASREKQFQVVPFCLAMSGSIILWMLWSPQILIPGLKDMMINIAFFTHPSFITSKTETHYSLFASRNEDAQVASFCDYRMHLYFGDYELLIS